jgi:hypothetical protein
VVEVEEDGSAYVIGTTTKRSADTDRTWAWDGEDQEESSMPSSSLPYLPPSTTTTAPGGRRREEEREAVLLLRWLYGQVEGLEVDEDQIAYLVAEFDAQGATSSHEVTSGGDMASPPRMEEVQNDDLPLLGPGGKLSKTAREAVRGVVGIAAEAGETPQPAIGFDGDANMARFAAGPYEQRRGDM